MDSKVSYALFPQLRLDLRGRVVDANAAAGELLSYLEAEGRLAGALESARRHGARAAEIALHGRFFRFDIQPEAGGFALFGREITEERQLAAALRQDEARLRALLEAAPDPILTVTDDDLIDFINPGGEQVFGFAPGSLMGRPVVALLPDWHRAPAVVAVKGGAGTQRDGAGAETITGVRADGSRFPVEVNASGLDRDGRLFVTAILRDVTEREAAAREIRDLNQQLQGHVEQLTILNAELESFSYSVSHDLRGPLRSIDGFSAIVVEEYGERLDDEGREFLQRIRAATARMADLIDGLLRLSRITRAELRHEAVDLSAMGRFVADGLRRESPGRGTEVVIEEGLVAEGDRALLTVALENLIGNAWKFTSRRDAGRVVFGSERRPEGRVFYVRDNGAGFDMAGAGTLFTPFGRLHGPAEFPGSGIGLATVERIIRRHGGAIWAEGVEGEGAVFYFTLP